MCAITHTQKGLQLFFFNSEKPKKSHSSQEYPFKCQELFTFLPYKHTSFKAIFEIY